MSELSASDNLRRLVMAELVREYLADEDGPGFARVAKVIGYREREVECYPGTSSAWKEDYVDIYWVDGNEAYQTYEWRGTTSDLNAALERLVEAY